MNQILTQTTKDCLVVKIPFNFLEKKIPLNIFFQHKTLKGNGLIIWQCLQSLPKQLWKIKGSVFIRKTRKENELRLKKLSL